MAVTSSYTTLLANVADWLSRGDLTNQIPVFVQNFEERFYRNPKNWGPWMETSYSAAMVAGVSAVPTGFLAWKNVYISSTPSRRLDPVGLSNLYDRYPRNGCTSTPTAIARNGSNFEYGPYPSSNFTVAGTYYQKPTALRSYTTGGADAVAHYLILNAPDLLLYGALIEAAPLLEEDDRLGTWQGFLQTARDDYQALQKATNISGGPMQVRVG
jgi:hypothetical protein